MDAHFAAKAPMYKTARATIACAYFQKGDHVAVEFHRVEANGTVWFKVASRNGSTFYPAHHLTNFVL